MHTACAGLAFFLFLSAPQPLGAAGYGFAAPPEKDGKVIFEDNFSGKLGPGWRWLREVAGTWRVRSGALEIRNQPGDGHTVKTALLRAAPGPERPFAVEVTVTNEPTEQYEQAGIVWYRDGRPLVKLVKELVDGKVYVVLSGAGFFAKVPLASKRVELRFEVDGKRFRGAFRPDGKGEWREIGGKELPRGGKEELSIQCYHGPKDAEHWVRFERFRIVELAR